jgi:xanthine dehydrogenase molybdopterin binding subunit
MDADGSVTLARLAYGGVAPMPKRAVRAENALLGKTLESSRAEVQAILRETFTPIDDARGSAEYRRGLAVSLWEKFLSGEDDELAEFRSGGVPAGGRSLGVLATSAGGGDAAETDDSRALAHESAIGHVTGRAEYVDDLAQRRPMLEIWPVCAPHAHARIVRRNATAARRALGVHAVLMAEDVPGRNDVGVSCKDEILLADTEALYHGHLVALVVGETIEACRAAAALVEVDYEPLTAILTVPEAIAAGSFHTEPNFMRRGDAETALARSAHTIEGVFECGGQEHFYLETHAAWAETDGEGNVFVCSSTQHPSEVQTIVAEVLGLPRNRVVVQAPRMGGGFGGKETQGNAWAAVVALAAFKTGKPVRVQLDRDLDMQLTGKRHPFFAKFRAGFDGDGRFTALKCEIISNGGWSLDLSMPVTDRAMFHIDNAYYIPAVEVSGRVAKTHLTSQTAFRGFGGPQGMLIIEEIVDRIARTLGLAPEVVRERNLYHFSHPPHESHRTEARSTSSGNEETNTTHYGQPIGDDRLPEIWRQLLISADFAARRTEIARWNAGRATRKRGLAITPVKFGISFTATFYNQAGALVLIYRDGTVQVNHGGTEMGQGLHTKIVGIVMRELGVRREAVRVMPTATDKVPNTSATAASSGSDLNGAAVAKACGDLRARLAPIAKQLRARGNEPGFVEIVEHAYMQRVSLAATGHYATPEIHWDRATGKGRPFYYFACGAAVSEVEVDGSTGMSSVRRVDVLHDVGDSLNPGIDRGQIEGGFVQGMGWLTCEDVRWDARGVLQSHSASTYQIPAFSDAPADFRVTLFPRATQPGVIHGSKAVGEPPLMLAISVREAIRDAVAAFRNRPGEVALASPATCEAVWTAIRCE